MTGKAAYLTDVLEAVNDEALDGDASQHLVVVDLNLLHCVEALDFRKQDERVEVVVRKHQLLQLGELAKLVQVLVIDDQVKADIVEVHLLDLVIELGPLQHLKCVTIDVEHFIGLYLCVAALNDALLVIGELFFAELLLVEAIDLSLPLFLDNLDHVALVLWLEDGQLDLDWALLDDRGGLGRLLLLLVSLETLLVIRLNLGRNG